MVLGVVVAEGTSTLDGKGIGTGEAQWLAGRYGVGADSFTVVHPRAVPTSRCPPLTGAGDFQSGCRVRQVCTAPEYGLPPTTVAPSLDPGKPPTVVGPNQLQSANCRPEDVDAKPHVHVRMVDFDHLYEEPILVVDVHRRRQDGSVVDHHVGDRVENAA